ncbi:hypothetical protein QTH90_28990 [Variovorax sp. J2P1-59]|uniref:hypothetical protein n=1 Tax=Variovorax flavidus TaxID=3053501 RepID=UPI002576AD3F|nr:hypothetical protein [Variovorax sp. J2P1-59]MDM0078475.1 hypothetical protein [Variovorax sp. J2P1-59]
MLTIDQKERILRQAGVAVPDFPPGHARTAARNPDVGEKAMSSKARMPPEARQEAVAQWAASIEALYVEYVAKRAAKSLRDAEDARRLGMLREAAQRGPDHY